MTHIYGKIQRFLALIFDQIYVFFLPTHSTDLLRNGSENKELALAAKGRAQMSLYIESMCADICF